MVNIMKILKEKLIRLLMEVFSEKTLPIMLVLYPLLLIMGWLSNLELFILFCILLTSAFFYNSLIILKSKKQLVDPITLSYKCLFLFFLVIIISAKKSLALLFIPIFLFLMPFQIRKFLEPRMNNKFTYIVTYLYSELLFFLLALFSFFNGLIKFINFLSTKGLSEHLLNSLENNYLVILITILLISIFLRILFISLIEMTKFLHVQINKEESIKMSLLNKFLFIGLFIIILIAPSISFGLIYDFFTKTYNLGNYNFWDLTYFSFALQYAMPMEASLNVFKLREALNVIPTGRIIQFVHITTTKVIELTILASIGSFFLQVIRQQKD
jgi:hypothetical protein